MGVTSLDSESEGAERLQFSVKQAHGGGGN
jgi:hypothetical protein